MDTADTPAVVPAADEAVSVGGQPGTDERSVMGMLHDHVPLSLLVDLSARSGPSSEAILDEEGDPDEDWWAQP